MVAGTRNETAMHGLLVVDSPFLSPCPQVGLTAVAMRGGMCHHGIRQYHTRHLRSRDTIDVNQDIIDNRNTRANSRD